MHPLTQNPRSTSHRPAGRRLITVLLALALTLVAGASWGEERTFSLKLEDAEISALINTVAEATGRNFVVDPRVKGKVTVVSAKPMNADELYQVFLSILEVHGFAAVPAGEVIKIIPDAKARQVGDPAQVSGALRGDEIVTRVIAVQNISATQLLTILRPLVPQEGHLAAHAGTNVLVISDRASNVDRLVRLIARIDRASESEVEVIHLNHASATDVVRLVKELDVEDRTQGGQRNVRIVADERSNAVFLAGDQNVRLRLRALIAHIDTPLTNGGNVQVVYLRYAKAEDVVPILTGVSQKLEETQQGKPAAAGRSDIDIQADEPSNALIITAPPDVFRELQDVIRKIDIRRAQVLVEAVIAEVSLDKARDLGVEWVFDGSPGGKGAIGVINLGSIAGVLNAAAELDAGGSAAIPDGTTIVGGRTNDADFNFAAVVRAIARDTSSNVLSTPSVLTLDNEEAEIIVGQNVPFVTGSFTTTGDTGSVNNPFQTIERQDVGVMLRVRPQINEGDAIKLEIQQEVSSVVPSAEGAADLTTQKRQITTTVMVDDGEVVVLGGLIDDGLQLSEAKVPLLGDIPVLGYLFRYNRTTTVKRNLMVFLRPVIVRDAATHTGVTGGKYSYMRLQQLEMRDRGIPLIPDDEAPLLPESYVELPMPFGLERSALEPEPGTAR